MPGSWPDGARGTANAREDPPHRAVALAERLLREARAGQTAAERAQARKLARMMGDRHGKELTIALIDQAFRSRRPERIADQLAHLLSDYGAPRYMDWWERAALVLGGVMGQFLPSVVVPPIVSRLRQETQSLILPGEEEELAAYLAERRRAGIRLNLNQLGEAILGEAEAGRRLEAYRALLARDDVEYISVKVSSVFSQINLVAFRSTVERVKDRLRTLYRDALAHRYRHPDGRVTAKFINLDMEEYRDLDLTVTAFQEVLVEDEFLPLSAGIVLQAYLPEAFRVQRALIAWAAARGRRGGAPIKIRIVKGANLAMERIEASLHGWPQAPYPAKAEVDANYKRMVEYGTRPDHARVVHLGIASHNLFDIAHGLVLRAARGVEREVEFEMLEGMANHQARAVQSDAGGLLLYAPVVRAEDFHSAIAYLVRRLDENTAEENFLRHVFDLSPGGEAWRREADRFLSAFAVVDGLSDAPRRLQDRRAEEAGAARDDPDEPFDNEPDTDWSLPANRIWADALLARIAVRGEPTAVRGEPTAVRGEPTAVRGEPTASRANMEMQWNQPQGAEMQWNQPQGAEMQWNQPQGAEVQWNQPQGAEVQWNQPQRTAPLEIPLQVAGTFIPGAQATRHDPSRPGQRSYVHALADLDRVDEAVDAARRAVASWAARSIADRRAVLRAGALVLGRRRADLIGAMIVDGAKTITEADAEVSEAIDFARYYADALADAASAIDGCEMRPLGVVVIAPPWNFPLSIPAGGVLAALAAGNAVVLKPAPEAVLVGWHLAAALWDAGVPRVALQFLPCPDDEVGRRLISDARVDAVILTGSIETARLFLGWRPDLALFAETSGKNAMIVTGLADRDQAIRDLVRSAFGHNGQKCSAASLAICEAEVYDDPVFRRQLRDAAASLDVGTAWEPVSRMTPLTQPPGAALRRALTTLDDGEEWLLEPRQDAENPLLWSPGIKLGVTRGSFFHRTECFGPVLGLMRAESLDEAIDLANDTPYGLTSGIQSLDDREVERWIERIEAGNLYVNRHVTGAIVRRQPFGGWKASSVGPGAKAGGPNYVLQLARWTQRTLPAPGEELPPEVEALLSRCLAEVAADRAALLGASAADYARAWRTHFGVGHDPSGVLGEDNVFRYRPCRGVAVRADPDAPEERIAFFQILLATELCGTPLSVSLPGPLPWPWLLELPRVTVFLETPERLAARLRAGAGVERLRTVRPPDPPVREAANEALVAVVDAPVLATGRLELRWYLREQTISRVRHRYGNIMSRAAG